MARAVRAAQAASQASLEMAGGPLPSSIFIMPFDPPDPSVYPAVPGLAMARNWKRFQFELLQPGDVCHRTGHTNMLCSMLKSGSSTCPKDKWIGSATVRPRDMGHPSARWARLRLALDRAP